MATKAIIYCRFSPRPGAAECQSNEVQLAACRKYCADRGYTIVGEHSDAAASGDDVDRPGLWDAVNACRRGYVLVVAKLDRLARSVTLDGYIRHTLDGKGATVEAADGTGSDETAESKMLRQMLAAIAEYNKQITGARTRAAMLHAQANGKAMSKQPPYGWRRVRKALEIEPTEQATIAMILAYRSAGLGFGEIADRLTAEGVEPRGSAWHRGTIRKICLRGQNSPVQSCTA